MLNINDRVKVVKDNFEGEFSLVGAEGEIIEIANNEDSWLKFKVKLDSNVKLWFSEVELEQAHVQ